jgi:hypothetical protein
VDVIKFLLENAANPDIRNYEGENSVFLAVRWCKVDVLTILLDASANPNLYNKNAASALHLCVDFKAEDHARTLLMKGGDPNYQNNQGQTPFHVACERKESVLAQVFYESGADPEVRDADLWRAWDCCDEEFRTIVTEETPEVPLKPNVENLPEPDAKAWLYEGKCFVCQQLLADKLVLPCRHKVLCHNCSAQFFELYSSCPQCYMSVYAATQE